MRLKDADGNDFNLESVVAGLITKNGNDPSKALETLVQENYGLRSNNRELKDQIEKLKVPEGSTVLAAEDAKIFEEFKALGKLEEIKKTIESFNTVNTELNTLKKESVVREAANLHKYKFNVLNDLVTAKGLQLEIGETEVQGDDGKTTKQAVALVKDQAGNKTILTKVIEDSFKDYIPSLALSEQQNTGTSWIPQSSGGKAPEKVNLGAAYLNMAYGDSTDKGK